MAQQVHYAAMKELSLNKKWDFLEMWQQPREAEVHFNPYYKDRLSKLSMVLSAGFEVFPFPPNKTCSNRSQHTLGMVVYSHKDKDSFIFKWLNAFVDLF